MHHLLHRLIYLCPREYLAGTDTLGLGVEYGLALLGREHMEKVHRLDLPENVKVFSMFALGLSSRNTRLSRISFIRTEFTLSKNKIKN